jgi:acetolactate synthase small subunit
MDIKHQTSKIKDRTGVIDVIAENPKTGEVVLVMNEPNEWDGSDEELLALQERFNAYVSFLLDGELAEVHPELVGKPARIELRCGQMPDARALEFLGLIHDQLAFQEIKLEVIVTNDPPSQKATE